MVVIIGGRQAILRQIPEELVKAHPRLLEPLTAEQCEEMMKHCMAILGDPEMAGNCILCGQNTQGLPDDIKRMCLASSHALFSDIIRLVLALQLSVAESRFK